jgi:hypothetical protein
MANFLPFSFDNLDIFAATISMAKNYDLHLQSYSFTHRFCFSNYLTYMG